MKYKKLYLELKEEIGRKFEKLQQEIQRAEENYQSMKEANQKMVNEKYLNGQLLERIARYQKDSLLLETVRKIINGNSEDLKSVLLGYGIIKEMDKQTQERINDEK